MSPAFSNPEDYEHPCILDNSDDPLMQYYWPEVSSMNDRAWYQLDPSLDPVRSHPTYSMDRSPTAYDPIAHGFAEPLLKPDQPLPFQHNMKHNWPFAYVGNHPHRHRSPASGISLSSIDSGSPIHAMSPEIATAMLPALVSDYNFYPSPTSEPGAQGLWQANTPHEPAASSYPSPAMMSPAQVFNMKEFMLHQQEFQEDDTVDSSDVVEVKAPLSHQLDLSQAEDVESGVSQSVDECYIGDDAAAEDNVEHAEEDIAVENGDDSDYEPSRPRIAAARLRARSHRPGRGSNASIQDSRARVRKPSATPKRTPHARAPSTASIKSKPKTTPTSKRPIPTLNAAPSHNAPKTRQPFPCPFHHFGCHATFPSKNEWKRHALAQHLRLGFYRCDLGACAMEHPSKITARRGFNDFNRKDLFTQHCRRMHKPDGWGRKEYNEVSSKERTSFDRTMEAVRERCWVQKREAPADVGCGFCDEGFSVGPLAGRDVWEVRMEHVAKHYEREGREQADEALDQGLVEWAAEHEVIAAAPDGQWCLVSLLGGESEGVLDVGETVRRKGKGTRPGLAMISAKPSAKQGRRRSARFEARGAKTSYADLDEGTVEVDMGDEQTDDESAPVLRPSEQVAGHTAEDDDDDGAETDTDAPGEEEWE